MIEIPTVTKVSEDILSDPTFMDYITRCIRSEHGEYCKCNYNYESKEFRVHVKGPKYIILNTSLYASAHPEVSYNSLHDVVRDYGEQVKFYKESILDCPFLIHELYRFKLGGK